MNRTLIILTLLSLSFNLYAQRVITARGTEMYVIPKNMTLEHAERLAVEQAKLKVIADNFGTIVGASTALTISDGNGMSSIESFTFGETEVKGEWLETIGQPLIERKVVNNDFVIAVTIAGKIREIISAPIEFKAKILRNGVEDNCESNDFKERDKMYVSFQSAEEGHLSIYMTDGKIVQCLYPYRGLSSDYMKVEADKRYVFFSKKNSGELDPMRVMECQLACEADNEYNRIYVIFSPNKYSKPIDQSASNSMIRTLTYNDFHAWLSKQKRLDTKLHCKPFDIVIKK